MRSIYRISHDDAKMYGNSRLALRRPYYNWMDIVLVDFGQDYSNCVVGDYRQAIVISNTEYNRHSPVMQVIPLTKQLKAIDMDYHVFLDRNDCEGFEESGMCLLEQITTVDRRQVRRKIASVKIDSMKLKIEIELMRHLGFYGEAD